MTYSVYARDRKTGREYALPHRYFGNLPTRDDAQVALEWYIQTSSASAHELVEVYILEHVPMNYQAPMSEELELTPA